MKIRLRFRKNGKVIQTFTGELSKEPSYDCGLPGCPALILGSCDTCKLGENPDYYNPQRQAEIWRNLKSNRYSTKSCLTCFFATPNGSPDIGLHTTCMDCSRLSRWKRKPF